MIKIIDQQDVLARYQQEFKEKLYTFLPKQISHTFGHLGVDYPNMVVHTNGDLWYYGMLADEPAPNRHWNAFGFISPYPSNIITEINFPLKGINRRIAGVLGFDSNTREVSILHRGRIGGGKPGIGKIAFMDYIKKRIPSSIIQLNDGGNKVSSAIFVCKIVSDTFLDDLSKFIHEVYDFKKNVVL